jgi:hypothetical protein
MGRLLSLPTRPARRVDLNRGQGQAQGADPRGRCRTGILDQATGTAALPLSPIDVDRVLRRRSYAFTPVSSRRSSRGRRATASSRCRRPPGSPRHQPPSASRNRLTVQRVGAPPVLERPRRLLIWVGDQAPAHPEHEREPVRKPTDIGRPDHSVVGPGEHQRHRGHAREHLHPLPPPLRMHQLEAGHLKRLVEEAHRRMLTRRPIVTDPRSARPGALPGAVPAASVPGHAVTGRWPITGHHRIPVRELYPPCRRGWAGCPVRGLEGGQGWMAPAAQSSSRP